jgi:hypothetical protein
MLAAALALCCLAHELTNAQASKLIADKPTLLVLYHTANEEDPSLKVLARVLRENRLSLPVQSVLLTQDEHAQLGLRGTSHLFIYNLGHNFTIPHARSERVLLKTLRKIENVLQNVSTH